MNPSVQRPAPSSVVLHWLVAFGVVGMLTFGYWIATLPKGPGKTEFVQLHKSFGMIVFMIAIVRIAWRARFGFPEAHGGTWERRAAHAAHWALLALTIAMPLSGVVRSLSYARPIAVFGLPVIPQLIAEKNEALNELAGSVHDACALALVAIILLHVLAALKHHCVDHDDTLRRMGPARRERLTEPSP